MALRFWPGIRRLHPKLKQRFHLLPITAVVVALAPFHLSAAAVAPGAVVADKSLETFRREIQPVLERYCYDCHGDGAEKGGVKLDGFGTSADLHDHTLWLRALRNVRAGIMPPVDEDPLPKAEADKLIHWIKREGLGLDPARPDPGRVTVRRLNRVEYRNTMRELMGVDYPTQKEFPADDTGHGFDNIGDVLTLSPILLEKYMDAAQAIVAQAVPTQPRVIAEAFIAGKKFAVTKIDTTLPPPVLPVADAIGASPAPSGAAVANAAPAAAGAPSNPAQATAPATAAGSASVTPAASAPNAAIVAAATPAPGPGAPVAPGAPGANQFRGRGRGNAGPPPVLRPVPIAEGDSLDLSYYTPATVSVTHQAANAGKYKLQVELRAVERYVDNQFDLNRCRLVVAVDGETVIDQEFVRENDRKFELGFDREWTAGEHTLTCEIRPVAPERPQIRALRLRLTGVTIKGPVEEKYWVKPAGYEKFFPRDVPAGVAARRDYAREIIGKFTTRAFRRPVDKDTVERLVAVAERISAQPRNTFEGGIAQAMVAVLASPQFIFREEGAEPIKVAQVHPNVDEYALASRLSYFLWSSMPDEELFRLASERKLRANLSAQVDRMLKDPRSGEFVRNFTGQWLQARDIVNVPITALDVYLRDNPNPAFEEARATLQRLQAVPREQRTPEDNTASQNARTIVQRFTFTPKPDLTDSLRAAMLQETEMTFGYVLQEDRSLLELLESNYTFLNAELAKHYGIEDVTGPQMRKVTLPEGSPRGGVLTQGTILAVTSNPTRTSPVKRGVLVLDAILGTPPAPPPPNIPALEDAATAEQLKSLSLRETMALHAKSPTCSSCHSRMDPLGLALENFNAMGMWRTTEFGQPITTAGKLITGETFADIRELKHVLATSRRQDFYHAVAEKMLTYALGRGVEYYDVDTLDQLVAKLEASGGKPSALLHGIVDSAPFQQRRLPTPPLEAKARLTARDQ